jgi:hypothetical protein
MYAESDNAINNGPSALAIEYYNRVRRRAYGSNPMQTHSKDIEIGMAKDDFLKLVQDERFKEFAFEGLRKHDLIRWGIYVSTMNSLAKDIRATAPSEFKYAAITAENTTARSVVFPIPNSEIAVNPYIIQNTGW